MSDVPVLVFLHGVGAGDVKDGWRSVLSQGLHQLGYPDLDDAHVIAPKFANALRSTDEARKVPPLTVRKLSREEARHNRQEYERRTGAIEFRLGRHDSGETLVNPDPFIGAAQETSPFVQARNYLTKPAIRAGVLHRILDALPSTGSVVIVGHSLGSVIAADLVPRFPVDVKVAGLVTIGSPLARVQRADPT